MSWLKLLVFIAFIGATRAHKIKLILLALLGLAGLYWMQNNRPANNKPKALLDIATHMLTKRDLTQNINIDWDLVLANDHSTCARSYICQLAATEARKKNEEVFLNSIRLSTEENNSLKEFRTALTLGENYKSVSYCKKIFKQCPYSKRMMMELIRLFS